MATDTDMPQREDQTTERQNERFNNLDAIRKGENGAAGNIRQEDPYVTANIDQMEAGLRDGADPNKNIDDIRSREENEFGYSYINKKGKEKLTGRAKLLKKLGPVGIIILLLGGGGGILMTLLTPGIALVHIKETVEQKVDTMSSVLDTRSNLLIASRLAGGSNKAISKYGFFQKYSTFSENQVKTMRQNNMEVLDKDGKTVQPDSKGRYKGVGYLSYTTGDGKAVKKVTARQYKSQMIRDPDFRSVMNRVYPSKFAAWKDKIATRVSLVQKWSKNPKSVSADSGGDPETNKKEFNKNLSQTTVAGDDVVDQLPNGLSDYEDAVNEEASNLSDDIDNGTSTRLTVQPSDVLQMPETNVKRSIFKSVGSGIVGTLNPADVLVGACGAYKYGQALVFASKVIAAAQMIRYASDVLATGDKIKAGEATANDVGMMMTMMYATNKFGQSFGDSAGYHYAAYGKTTSTPVAVAGTGNPVFSFVSNSVRKANNATGGNTGITCSVISNAGTQILLAAAGLVAAVLSGGSSAAVIKGGEVVGKEGAQALVRKLAEQAAAKFTEKFATKEAAMAALKQGSKDFLKYSGQVIGFAITGKIISSFLTPYLAHLAAGTLFGGDQDGVAAMDALVGGAAMMSGSVAQQRGLTPLTRKQALAFNDFNTASNRVYVADRKHEADPLDAYNPYSTMNSIGFALSNTIAPQKLLQSPASLLAVPSKVLASIKGSSTAYAASSQADMNAIMDECGDQDMIDTGLATDVFCNPIYGFPDTEMLKTTTPDDVAAWMYAHQYINEDGYPIGDYKDYYDKCFGEATANQVISKLLGDTESALPPECYLDNSSEKSKYWHLYQVDETVIDTAENGFPLPVQRVDGYTGLTGAPSGKIKVASFNIRHKGDPTDKGYATWESRLHKAADTIGNNKIDVAGLQEVYQDQQVKLLDPDFLKSSKYGITYKKWPTANKQPDFVPNPIVYNADKYRVDESKSKTFQIIYDGAMRKNAVLLKLDEIDGAGSFYIINTHDPATGRRQGSNEIRLKNTRTYIDLINKVANDNTPIFVTGDFNSQYGTTQDVPHCLLSSSGIVKDTWETFKDIAGCAPGRPVGGEIDRVYASKNLPVTAFDVVPHGDPSRDLNTNNGSDHPTIIATVDFGDNSTGLQGGAMTFGNGYASICASGVPTSSFPGISCSRECVDYVKYALLRFYNSKFKGGTLGNGKDVTSTLGGKYGYKVNSTPAVGAVFSTSHTRHPEWGHTGMVSKVNLNIRGELTSIEVEEYNYTNDHAYDRRTISASEIKSKAMSFAHTEVDLK